jgi:glycosyltransferase involved in cell wall biosynthesis
MSPMVIHIIASALPPKLDGIGDYTALLSVELAKSERIKVLTDREQTPYPITGVEVTPAFTKNDPKSYWDLLPIIEADKPDWVLLQYNPFSYGHRGLNLQLPEVMRQIKKRCPGTKVAVMVHEMFVPLTNWKFLAMSPWQRWQFWRLAGDADVMFFSVGIWADKVRPLRRGRPTLHLPVGSNIPHVSITRTEARARLGITDNTLVLGLFGNAHIEKKLDVVRDAAHALSEAGHNITVLHLGSDKVTVGELLKNIPMIADGALPAEEVSCRFAAMDIHLLPFSDGISTRRTTLMTGLQHGIATVGTK